MCNNCAESRKAAEKMAEDMSSAEKSREFYRRQGECRERERIIKILESDVLLDYSLKDVIALIKGENK